MFEGPRFSTRAAIGIQITLRWIQSPLILIAAILILVIHMALLTFCYTYYTLNVWILSVVNNYIRTGQF